MKTNLALEPLTERESATIKGTHDKPRLSPARLTAAAAGACALLTGMLTLLGYALDVRRLTDWNNDGISMFPNTAICAVFSGAALLAAALGHRPFWRMAVRVLAGMVALLCVLVMFQHLSGVDLGIDTLLFQTTWGQRAAAAPMRMGPPASIAYLLSAVGLVLASYGARGGRVAAALAISVIAISSLSLIGYWFGANQLFGIGRTTGIAFQTSVVLAILGAGLMALVPNCGLAGILGRDDPGGAIARRLLPPIIAIPLVLGWLRVQAQEAGYFDTAFGTAMLSLLMIALLIGVLVWTANGVSRQASLARAAHQAIAENAVHLRTTLDSIGDAVIATDASGIVTMMNPVAEALTGWTFADARGRPLREVFHIVNEQTRQEVADPAERALREGSVVGLANHTILIAKDGSEQPIDDSAAPIKDAQGKTLGCVLIFRDISQRRKMENERGEAAARLDSLFAHAPIGIALFDTELRFLTLNDRAAEVDGISKDAHVGKTVPELLPDLGSQVEALLRRVRDTGQPILGREVSGETPAAPGQQRHWIANYYPVRNGCGKAIAIGAVALEITDRKRAEEELRHAEEQTRSIVENVIDSIITIDEQGLVQSFNPAAERTFGYAASEVIGQNVKMLMPEPYHSEHDDYLRSYLRTGLAKIIGIGREVIGRRKNGTTFPMDLGVSEFRVGDRRYFTGIVRDITERKKLEHERDERAADLAVALSKRTEEMRRAEAAEKLLRDADRRKDEFLATLAHELRNPLAPILNSIAMLEAKGDDGELVAWCRDIIDRQAHHMSRLLDDLLDVSRIAGKKLKLRIERVPLAQVLETAIEASLPHINARRHELAISLPGEPIWLDADPVRLGQVFLNLLNNAAKYTEPGGKISLSAELRGRDAVVTVTDNGIGVDPEELPRLFEIFSQAAPALERSQGGLGIGLALAKGLVEMHHGVIEAKSEGPGRGASFEVRLPIAAERSAAATSRPVKGIAPAAIRHRILIADDNEDGAQSLARLLKVLGHEVHVVYDGEAALEAVGTFRPNVALLDIGMPKLNGHQVARQLRADPARGTVTLMALTGWGRPEDRQQTEEAGFHHHLIKPVDLMELCRLLEKVEEANR